MYVTREIVSPGWLINRNQQRTLICRRPNVRDINGRYKLLKAIIGRQVEKIRDLNAKLCGARQVIVRSFNLNIFHVYQCSQLFNKQYMKFCLIF